MDDEVVLSKVEIAGDRADATVDQGGGLAFCHSEGVGVFGAGEKGKEKEGGGNGTWEAYKEVFV